MIRLFGVFLVFLFTCLAIGGRAAVWLFWPPCLTLLPNGTNRLFVGSLWLSFDRLIGLSGLMILYSEPGRRLRPRPADLAVLALMLIDGISLTLNVGFRPLALAQLPLFYILYPVGRLYLRDASDLPRAINGMVLTLVAGAALTFVEAVFRLQPILILAIGRSSPDTIRFGLMRARLGTSGPIPLGMLILLMLPWALEASRLARRGEGRPWWRLAPLGAIWILLTTMSRGPILAALVFPPVALFVRRPSLRRAILGTTVVLALVIYWNLDELTAWLHSLIASTPANSTVLIDGQLHAYNGTVHRSLLYKVYREPMRQAGLFGFDVNWPVLQPPRLAFYFGSVDNAYIATRMKRGLAGLLALDLLLALTIWSTWRMARQEGHPLAPFAGRLLAGLIGLTLALFTVALFEEPRGLLLMTAGIAAWFDDVREDDRRRREEEPWPEEEPPWPEEEPAWPAGEAGDRGA